MNKIVVVLLVFGLLVGCTPTVEKEGVVRFVEPTTLPTPPPPPVEVLMGDTELIASTTDNMLVHWKEGEFQQLVDVEEIESTIWSHPMLTDNQNYVVFEQNNVLFCMELWGNNPPIAMIPDVIYTGPERPKSLINVIAPVPESDYVLVSRQKEYSNAVHTQLVACNALEKHPDFDTFSLRGRFLFSPNRETIAIATTATLFTSTPTKGRINHLKYDPVYTYTGSLKSYPVFVWSPQSNKLRIVIHPQDWMLEQRHDPTTIYEIDVETGDVQEMVKIKHMGIRVREPHTTVFSDSGDWLAYYTLIPSDDTPSEIIESHRNVINLTTLEQRTILENESANFAISKQTIWSPDDDYLVYATDQVYVGENTFPSHAPLKVVRLADERVFDVDESAIFHGWVQDDLFVYVADSAVKLAEVRENGVVSYTVLEGVTQLHDVTSTYP